MTTKLFVDSDVIISSLLSSTGAAFLLLNKLDTVQPIISNYSITELELVMSRLNIDNTKLEQLLKNRLQVVQINQPILTLKQKYQKYVLDPNDAHILAAAIESKSSFLMTYNIRHYKIDAIKKDFKLIALTPAMFLQYLRSL